MKEPELINPIIVNDDVESFINSKLTKMSIGEIRSSQHLTKKKLSELSGLSVKCIADIESLETGNPTFKSLLKYLNTLGWEVTFQKRK